MNSTDYQGKYVPLTEWDTDGENSPDVPADNKTKSSVGALTASLPILTLVAIVSLVAGFLSAKLISATRGGDILNTPRLSCANPSTRREWRSLSSGEKEEYINAVRCLTSKPSKQMADDSLYDDFAYIHIDTGEPAYNSAAFLPYHRYLLHVYESELKSSCGYNGSLPYWDWTLDWEDLPASPAFSNTIGFGSIASTDLSESGCVKDGPFSDLHLPFYGNVEHPNCIWRALPTGLTGATEQDMLSIYRLHPIAMDMLLSKSTYTEFLAALGGGPRVHIPNGIAGDFLEFTAANDPLFILHHAQLDRLWWMWQQLDPETRLWEYPGRQPMKDGSETGPLDEIVSLGKLAFGAKVDELMDSRSSLLCYKY